ncbi:MAG: NAD(P)/FAD-dependent oxidoreductase [Pseudomonadota bacterium]
MQKATYVGAMKIAIAGAGIGGLAAAALLAQDGHSVTVFDQFHTPRPVGSGLVIQPVGRAVLKTAGADAAIGLGVPIARMEGIEAETGRQVLGVSYGHDPDRYGLAIHRAALHHSLLGAARKAGAQTEFAHRVAGHTGPRLAFTDKPAQSFDLIVDALGAGSVLSPLKARDLPFGAVWATVEWPEGTTLPLDQLCQRYRRADRMVGILPVGQMPDDPTLRATIFWSLPAEAERVWRAAPLGPWRDEVIALWPEAEPFFHSGLSHGDFTFARYTHGSLRRPYSEHVVHIGDAAHRASPQLGQGANMALLDARALQLALRRPDDPLRRYAQARRWHVAAYQALSAAFTPQYQSHSQLLPVLRDHVLAPISRVPPMPWILSHLVCGDLLPPMPSLTPLRR